MAQKFKKKQAPRKSSEIGNHPHSDRGIKTHMNSKRPTEPPLPSTPRHVVNKTERLKEKIPLILETAPDDNYALLDCGYGRKLEQYGPYRIVRPEAQALWSPALDEAQWKNIDAEFTGDIEEEGPGRWRFAKTPMGETWPLEFDGIAFHGRFTSFRHVGVFPEQAAHWHWMYKTIKAAHIKNKPLRVLNLFGYTGVASLVAAKAGAEITHVDASKKAIGWAQQNQELAGMQNAPIRWICDDALKFVLREARRGKTYDGILLDPPKYGRGPKGEVWQLFDQLPDMLSAVEAITSPKAHFVVLTSYAVRASFYSLHELMQEVFSPRRGKLESGELVLRAKSGERRLSTSLFSRWIGEETTSHD